MNIIKEEVEGDVRTQLRRQAAAHNDHIQDLLNVQVSLPQSVDQQFPHGVHGLGGRDEKEARALSV